MTVKLEICIEHASSAVAAQAGGADRIELCTNLWQGGTTPSIGHIEVVREAVGIDIMVMIRPRGGDFYYSDTEFRVMQRNLHHLQSTGINGVVFGLLNPNGTIDRYRMAKLIEAARPLEITFHRAFDLCRDPLEALDTLLDLGVDRILTSGQAPTATAGIALIQRLQAHAGKEAIILPGGSVSSKNAGYLINAAGVSELHVSTAVKRPIRSQMRYRDSGINVGQAGSEQITERLRVSTEKVRDLKAIMLRALEPPPSTDEDEGDE